MKLGIITLFGLRNIGNRLQNYATNSYLTKLGFKCKTIILSNNIKNDDKKIIHQFHNNNLSYNIEDIQTKNPFLCRILRFEEFNKKYIPLIEKSDDVLNREFAGGYDFFVAGSDQIWNPYFCRSTGQLENYLLAFAPPPKRVCFAPSVGVDDIPDLWYETFEREWSKYRLLSAREQAGADLIKKITGRDALAVIDPTLMIMREEWASIARPLPGFDYEHDYILYYLLGNPDDELSVEMIEAVKRQKKRFGLRSIQIFDPDDPILSSVGPEEFIYLIAKSRMICTDSFHGAVFSILFRKPFLLVERKLHMQGIIIDMSSRFNTLLSKLGLEDRAPGRQKMDDETIWNIDFENVYVRLAKERRIADRFLRRSFRIEDDKK